jgi:hypothetical protein
MDASHLLGEQVRVTGPMTRIPHCSHCAPVAIWAIAPDQHAYAGPFERTYEAHDVGAVLFEGDYFVFVGTFEQARHAANQDQGQESLTMTHAPAHSQRRHHAC